MPIHLQRGARDSIAFVFSCPGRREREERKPAAGDTGTNLEGVLCFMRQRNCGLGNLNADDWTRENIWITNAWPRIEYPARTGRRQARVSEVLCTENITRLAGELCNINNIIVCCGIRAQRAVGCLGNQGRLHCAVRIIPLCHLGNQALNGWIPNSGLNQLRTSRERRLERLRRWAHCLYNQIAANQNNP